MDELQYFISVPEAARRAGVARNTMRLAAQNGHIRAIKPGRNWLVDARDITRWKQEDYQPDMARHSDEDAESPDSADAP